MFNKRTIGFIAALTFSGSFASGQEIYLDIILAKNVKRDKAHYLQAAKEANRILQQCTGVSVKLQRVRKLTGDDGTSPVKDDKKRSDMLKDISDLGANIFIVNDLRVCGSLTEPEDAEERKKSNVLGCAGPGSSVFLETIRDSKIEGRAIAHEIGHSSSLMWNANGKPHSNEPENLMYYSLNPRVKTPVVKASECAFFVKAPDRFKKPKGGDYPDAVVLAQVEGVNGNEILDEGETSPVISELDDVLDQYWFETPPLDDLMQDERALSIVRSAMSSENSLVKRMNAAFIIGEYGEADDIGFLQDVVRSARSDSDTAELQRFVGTVIMAIGNLGVKYRETRAVEAIGVLLVQASYGDFGGLPTEGLDEEDRINIMSSAITSALEAAIDFQKSEFIADPEVLIAMTAEFTGQSTNVDEVRQRLLDSPLYLDPDLIQEALGGTIE